MKKINVVPMQGTGCLAPSNIWSACRKGDEAVVLKAIHQQRTLIHEPDPLEGRPPLFLASRSGHGSIVKLLLEAGARDRGGAAFTASKNVKVRQLLRDYDTTTVHCSSQDLTSGHSSSTIDSQMVAIENLKRMSIQLIGERADRQPESRPATAVESKTRKDACNTSTKPAAKMNAQANSLLKPKCKNSKESVFNSEDQEKKSEQVLRSVNRFWSKSDSSCESNMTGFDHITPVQIEGETREDKTDDKNNCRSFNKRTETTNENGQVRLYYYHPKGQDQQPNKNDSNRNDTTRGSKGDETTVVPECCVAGTQQNQAGTKNNKAKGHGLLCKIHQMGKKRSIGKKKNGDLPIDTTRSPKIDTNILCKVTTRGKCSKRALPRTEKKPRSFQKMKSPKRVTFSLNVESFHWDEVTGHTDEMSYLRADDLESESGMSEIGDDDNIVEDLIIGMSLIMGDMVRDGPQVVREAMSACFFYDAPPRAIYCRASRQQ